MLGRAQNFIKICIKTAHSLLSSVCTALFSLFCYFSTPFLPGLVGEANKQNHYSQRLKEKLASMVPRQQAGPSGSHLAWRKASGPFLCSAISRSRAEVRTGILASFPMPCTACLLLAPKPTFRYPLLHIADVLQIHSTLLSYHHTQDKFKQQHNPLRQGWEWLIQYS